MAKKISTKKNKGDEPSKDRKVLSIKRKDAKLADDALAPSRDPASVLTANTSKSDRQLTANTSKSNRQLTANPSKSNKVLKANPSKSNKVLKANPSKSNKVLKARANVSNAVIGADTSAPIKMPTANTKALEGSISANISAGKASKVVGNGGMSSAIEEQNQQVQRAVPVAAKAPAKTQAAKAPAKTQAAKAPAVGVEQPDGTFLNVDGETVIGDMTKFNAYAEKLKKNKGKK